MKETTVGLIEGWNGTTIEAVLKSARTIEFRGKDFTGGDSIMTYQHSALRVKEKKCPECKAVYETDHPFVAGIGYIYMTDDKMKRGVGIVKQSGTGWVVRTGDGSAGAMLVSRKDFPLAMVEWFRGRMEHELAAHEEGVRRAEAQGYIVGERGYDESEEAARIRGMVEAGVLSQSDADHIKASRVYERADVYRRRFHGHRGYEAIIRSPGPVSR